MEHILSHLVEALNRGEKGVLGTIVRSSGSAPRTSGAKMLVLEDGKLFGTIGGGAVEGQCLREAKRLMTADSTYTELAFELTARNAADEGMVCGGAITVLLFQVEPAQIDMYSKLYESLSQGNAPLFLTLLPTIDLLPQIMTYGVSNEEPLPEGMVSSLPSKKRRLPFYIQYMGREVFVEPLGHSCTVHLAGAGHVAYATAHLAEYSGFEVVVIDDREEFANIDRYPQVKEVKVLESFANCFTELGQDDYAVIVTRGHLHDREVLAQALKTEAGYIGMIGSRKKIQAIYTSLLEDGFTEQDLQRVHSPIGLAIGADTPEEIGISIVAQLIQVRSGQEK